MKKIILYLLIISLPTLLIACGPRQAEETRNNTIRTQELNSNIEDAVEGTAEVIAEGAEAIQEGANSMTKNTTEALNNSKNTIQNGVETGIDATAETINNLNDNTRLIAAKTKAQAELMAARIKLEAGDISGTTKENLDKIQANLAAVYESASEVTQEEWQDIQAGFQILSEHIESGTDNAIDELQKLINKLDTN